MPEPEAARVVDQGFGQDERQVGYAFVLENPNAELAIDGSQYQVAAYDEEGTVLETESGYVDLLLPGQALGVAGTMYLDEDVTVSSIEVQLRQGDPVAPELTEGFTVESIAYYPGEYSQTATGVVSSQNDRDLSDLVVSAVAYNAAGEIVGGGYTYLDFVLANTKTGVEVHVTSSGDVASVELYVAVTSLTFWAEDEEMPEGAHSITLLDEGYGQDEWSASFGILLQNPNDAYAVEDTQYHVTTYAEDGSVLSTEEGYVEILLAGETLGIGGSVFVPEDTTIARAETQVKPGSYIRSDDAPFFTAQNVSYKYDPYGSKVTGEIASQYEKELTDIRVSAIAYAEDGAIIGGGLAYLDFVPANGQAAVEVYVTSSISATTTELYATVSSFSGFELQPAPDAQQGEAPEAPPTVPALEWFDELPIEGQGYTTLVMLQAGAEILVQTVTKLEADEIDDADAFGAIIVIAALMEAVDQALAEPAPDPALDEAWELAREATESLESVVTRYFEDEITAEALSEEIAVVNEQIEAALVAAETELAEEAGMSQEELTRIRQDAIQELRDELFATPTPEA